jgi:UDP-N-acetylglucosamine/UDP-N-acetylgalactosamine diphosphorylase
MAGKITEIKEKLASGNQQQLLGFWDELDDKQKENLAVQIESLDFDQVDEWVKKYVIPESPARLPEEFSPAPAYPLVPATPQQQEKYQNARNHGKKLLRDGKVAAFVVAGGQGTRLGFDGPKGNYPVTPIKEKTLFQNFAETIAAANKKYDTTFPWYIMTSPLNHNPTVKTFEENDYFGLDPKNVYIFEQGTMPNFSFDGKILLADKDKIACSPDGHGGSLKALYDSGAVEDMKKRGIEHISYFQVDNPLINIFDELFIGLHALDKSQMSSKALRKRDSKEKLGVFCIADGKVTVIEYSDLPDEKAYQKNPDGSLTYALGSIAIHMIDVNFVEQLNEKGFSLPFHKAVKKIPHIDSDGNHIKPDKPNGIKLEMFVFDALGLAENSIILETSRLQEFAPVKNAAGEDSPEVTRKMLTERAADWLEAAGVEIPRKENGEIDAVIEMAPSFAISKDDAQKHTNRLPHISHGEKVYLE